MSFFDQVTAFIKGNTGAVLDAAPGSAAPANALQVGGSDGTNLRALLTNASGAVKIAAASVSTQQTLTNGTTPSNTSYPVYTNTFDYAEFMASFLVTGTGVGQVVGEISWDGTNWNCPGIFFEIRPTTSLQTSVFQSNIATTITPNSNGLSTYIFPTMGAPYGRIRFTSGISAGTTVILTTVAKSIPSQMPVVQPTVMNSQNGDTVSNFGPFVQTASNTAMSVIPYGVIGANAGNNYVGLRTPIVFKTLSDAASGNTALWTPASGKKFRLMRYIVEVTSNAALAAGAVLVVSMQDNTTDINQTHSVFVPGTAVTTGGAALLTTGWIDLGNGYLSAAANNVLNLNLSAALTAGVVRITCCGTEE